MASLLLDHPWRIAAAVNPASEAFEALETFADFIGGRRELAPIPFIDLDQYLELCGLVEIDPELRSTGVYLKLLAEPYVRWVEQVNVVTASPDPAPNGPPPHQTWRRALGEAMNDLADWRNPQIVVCKKHKERWPKSREISIRMSQTGPLRYRVLEVIEDYETHQFAVSDFDPWDLMRCRLAAQDARVNHPCRLPKHPQLERLSLEEIETRLQGLRKQGWRYRDKDGEKYCYIPPAAWNFRAIAKQQWRNDCRTFPEEEAGGDRGSGPIDCEDRIWVWDRGGKRHWDVQFPVQNREDDPDYWVISHNGTRLK